jgi:hypothetical protein
MNTKKQRDFQTYILTGESIVLPPYKICPYYEICDFSKYKEKYSKCWGCRSDRKWTFVCNIGILYEKYFL